MNNNDINNENHENNINNLSSDDFEQPNELFWEIFLVHLSFHIFFLVCCTKFFFNFTYLVVITYLFFLDVASIVMKIYKLRKLPSR